MSAPPVRLAASDWRTLLQELRAQTRYYGAPRSGLLTRIADEIEKQTRAAEAESERNDKL